MAVTLKPDPSQATDKNQVSPNDTGPVSATWLKKSLETPCVTISNQPAVRAVMCQGDGGRSLHLYNLNVVRKDTYHDEVTPAEERHGRLVSPSVRQQDIITLQLLTALINRRSYGDIKWTATRRPDPFQAKPASELEFTVPKLVDLDHYCSAPRGAQNRRFD